MPFISENWRTTPGYHDKVISGRCPACQRRRRFAQAKRHFLLYEQGKRRKSREKQAGKECCHVRTASFLRFMAANLSGDRVCPKICVNTIIGANRAILIQGGSRGIRLPSCLQHNAGGAGCQGRRSRLITLDIRAQRCYSGMRSAK